MKVRIKEDLSETEVLWGLTDEMQAAAGTVVEADYDESDDTYCMWLDGGRYWFAGCDVEVIDET